MNSRHLQSKFSEQAFHIVILIVCMALLPLLALTSPVAVAQEAPQAEAQEMTTEEAPKIPNDQLDSLVAPIALYPDDLLAQTLAASTYPLEVMQLDQWMDKNKNLKDKALADAVAKQPWDPSVQSMAAFPEVVQRMAENIQWMTDVGNAVLAQQKDVMDAVQRMRAKAQGTGNLKTGSEQKVETKTTQSGQQVIVVEQANPEAVYVPSYDPAVVYGAAPAEYPYYPYSYPGYQPGTALAWGTAIAVGGAWANDWGNCNWDDGNVTVNNNNNFNKNYNKNVNKGTGQGNGWQHNPQHRGNAPYANKQTANKYGGTARGEARQPTAGGAGKAGGPGGAGGVGGGKPGGPGGAGGAGGAGKPGGPGGAGGAGSAGKAGGPGGAGKAGGASGTGKASTGGAGKASGGSAAKASGSAGKGGADKVGGHKPSAGGGGGGAFAGGSGGSAKAASSRGGSSMKGGGGKGGGGGAKKGGGGGGGKKGGGGGGRRR